ARRVVDDVTGGTFSVASVKRATRRKNPPPPFTTSTMQQEASRKLNFQSSRVMRVAQELYEGVNIGAELGGTQGLITYMRTDSLRVSSEAAGAAEEYIRGKYGDNYYPASRRVYKSKANAQDAHEAIRPSNLKFDPESIKKYLTTDQYKLYKLIWSRFIASQMASAEIDTVSAELEAAGYTFRASGSTVKFNGFMAVYDYSEDGDEGDGKKSKLPELTEGGKLKCSGITPEQHFTEPPARYNEGSLVRFLEEKGIGRPSTFATIITTIISRGYVEREGKSLKPTPLGELTTDIMLKYFRDIVDYEFTAEMEDELDSIANGKTDMKTVLTEFYTGFEKDLENAEKTVSKDEIVVPEQETDIICEKCGARMVVKQGRFGKFAACPNYPECRNTKPLDKDGKPVEKNDTPPEKTGELCPLCGGDMLKRHGRYGSLHQLPEGKEYNANTQADRRALPEVRSTACRQDRKEPQRFLFLRKAPRLRFCVVGYADERKMPAVREYALYQEGQEAACLP
ncbi:MAG: DNA topoisomerase I, partial [Firmicutes bacterium CAG:272_52_7]